MKTRHLTVGILAIFLLPSLIFGQQWDGADNTTDPIYRTGNVGIGTASPGAEIEVNDGIILKGPAPYIRHSRSGVATEWNTYIDPNGNLFLANEAGVGGRIVVKPGGSVGIGTTNPSAKLDILDAISMDHVDNFPAEGSVYEGDWNTYIVAGTGTDGRTLRLGTSNDGYTSSEIELQNYNRWDGSKIFFKTARTSMVSPETRMFINYNGRVGIGTTNPQSKLAVNGTITAKEVEVTISGWPDHVFADNYSLMPLREVAAYIHANQHLPDMPSAAEVEENGVGLGEMQARLLQKVEELTLYVIDLKKENEALKERVAKLER